ncbi:MAG: MFS transporter [Chloroflexi bacterium]|nr:MFS transporter [Chloroflexota bacterium]
MSYRSLLSERRFLLLLLGQSVSTTGDWLASVALLVFAYQRTGSGLAVGAMGFSQALPAAVLGLLAGVLVDRWDRRLTMIGCDVARAALTLALATLPPLPLAFGAAAGLSLFGLLFSPAYEATIPNLVPEEKLVAANALGATSRQGLVLVGPALGALVVGLWGPGMALFLDGASFLASAASVAAAAPRGRPVVAGAQPVDLNLGRAFAEGLGFVLSRPAMRSFVVIDACRGLGIGIIIALSPVFMARALGLPPEVGGYLTSAAGAGMLGGSLLVGLLGQRWPTGWLLVGGMLVTGLSHTLFALAPDFASAAGLRVVAGVSLATSGVARQTLLQVLVPDALRGRVFGALTSTINLTTLIAMAAGGALADILGIREVFALAGLAIVAGGVTAFSLASRSSPGGYGRAQP